MVEGDEKFFSCVYDFIFYLFIYTFFSLLICRMDLLFDDVCCFLWLLLFYYFLIWCCLTICWDIKQICWVLKIYVSCRSRLESTADKDFRVFVVWVDANIMTRDEEWADSNAYLKALFYQVKSFAATQNSAFDGVIRVQKLNLRD